MKRYEVIAAAFTRDADLEDLLEEAEIPAREMPTRTSGDTWRQHCRAVVQRIEQGAFPNGMAKLITAAKTLRPDNLEITKLGAPINPALLDAWLHHVERANTNLTAAFDRPGVPQLLDHIYVELQVTDRHLLGLRGGRAEPESALGPLGQRFTLEEVLALKPGDFPPGAITRRWLLYGDPGSGKTTLLRHLAWKLAKGEDENSKDDAPWVPLFASLPRLLRSEGAWLDVLVADHQTAGRDPAALRALLEGLGKEGRLLLLFDGLDEVPSERRQAANLLLGDASNAWPLSPIVVTSRPIGGYRPGPDFRDLELLPFDDGDRRAFLERWLGDADRADALIDKARSEVSVWDLTGNPLYLTLLALLFEDKVEIPARRSALYDRILGYLLDGEHRPDDEPITRQALARRVLRHLADGMTENDLDAEAVGHLEDRLWRAPKLKADLDMVARWAGKPRRFLDDVAKKTSILGPHDGPSADWRYWHRTFREALAAEELCEQLKRDGEPALLERARKIEGDLGRWAEPYALLVGQVDVPDALVKTLMEVNRPLGLRALATAQGLAEETLNEIVMALAEKDKVEAPYGIGEPEPWQFRAQVFERIPELLDDADAALRLVERLRKRTTDGNDLFFLDSAAVEVGKRWPEAAALATKLRERLFDHLATPPEELFRWIETPHDGQVALWREMPAGTYHIGERANQEVTLPTGLQMAAVPVTNAQYQAFDPSFEPYAWDGVDAAELPNHPAVKLSWYEAMSFCRWLSRQLPGARLPTETEWEIACRAGTTTTYWSGDSEEDLARVSWYGKNAGGRTHRVGEKEANPWSYLDILPLESYCSFAA